MTQKHAVSRKGQNMAKLAIRSAYSDHVRITVPSGDGYTQEYEYKLNEKGQKQLVPAGKTNTLEYIQQFKDEVSIDNILARVAVGDMSVFRPDGIYQDTTQIPNNLNDARKVMLELENYWKTLPQETRSKFGNSLETFIAEAGQAAWLENLGLPTETIKEETPDSTTEAVDTTAENPE